MMSSTADSEAIRALLAEVKDPETGRGLVEMGQLQSMECEGNRVRVTVGLTRFSAPVWPEVQSEIESRLRERFVGLDASVQIAVHERLAEKLGEIGLTAKAVVAVGSGKGGVGKSTIAASIAYGLARHGCRVGLMDADVYGPSIPHLVGANRRPEIAAGRIEPIEVDGLKVMSMGFLVPPGEAVVWRGPMLHGAITQFLRDTAWGDLDYLLIDLPPGTGDIALTLSQLLPLTGAVVVCTPQDVALLDATKAVAMFRKVSIPVLGMVENMSYFRCPDCGTRYDIFGSGGARRRAAELQIPFLGELPINIRIRELGDAGRVGGSFTEPEVAPFFESICLALVKQIADARRANPPLPTLAVL